MTTDETVFYPSSRKSEIIQRPDFTGSGAPGCEACEGSYGYYPQVSIMQKDGVRMDVCEECREALAEVGWEVMEIC